ncbi:MAG: hypothetical protein Q9160_001149 [Pyrenula sp. 1 TL-2023]
MGRDKEKSVNPATAHLKAQKARQLKKGRAEAVNRRNEKLARRNPARLQRQIDDLKALESSGAIKPKEKQILEELERDVKAVKKAREALGDKAPTYGQGPRKDGRASGEILGKRKWDGERRPQNTYKDPSVSSGSETDESVRRIPMPRDTPPPIPRPRRPHGPDDPINDTQTREPHALPPKPAITPSIDNRTTYESAPQMRNLRQEAVSRFMPNVVRQKREVVKGPGKLLEPEEMDKLEQSGYIGDGGRNASNAPSAESHVDSRSAADAPVYLEAKRLAAEEERFRMEMEMETATFDVQEEPKTKDYSTQEKEGPSHQVEMEEVVDEDL